MLKSAYEWSVPVGGRYKTSLSAALVKEPRSIPLMRSEVMAKLWRDIDPYRDFPRKLIATDLQGWNSTHRYLERSVRELRPEIVVEIGVWKGASTVSLASALKQAAVDGVVIAVDTWLGSWDHWSNAQWFAELCFRNGYPSLFYKFLGNILAEGLENYVVPLPLDSSNAAHVLDQAGIRPTVIHLDGAHDFASVTQDLQRWWPLLTPGGVMICDDYDGNGRIWPEVRQAVDAFRASTPHGAFEWEPCKCWIRSSAA